MMRSMTGVGRGYAFIDDYKVIADLKSVNHRFRDIKLKLPSELQFVDFELRQMMNTRLMRGSIDLQIFVEKREELKQDSKLNRDLLISFIKEVESLPLKQNSWNWNPLDFYRPEFFLSSSLHIESEKQKVIWMDVVKEATSKSLDACIRYREEEGEKIKMALQEIISVYYGLWKNLEENGLQKKEILRKKWQEKWIQWQQEQAYLGIMDPGRLEQELFFYLQKSDVQEEMDRIKIHLGKMMDVVEN
jgi:uncharacterized protein (TIGR00255 family)